MAVQWEFAGKPCIINTIPAKKRDIWLDGSCFLARCHSFVPLYYVIQCLYPYGVPVKNYVGYLYVI